MTATGMRTKILAGVARFLASACQDRAFTAGETPVPGAVRAFDTDEPVHLADSYLDFWLTTGRYAARFKHEFASLAVVRHALLCNSGSSANLPAVAALTWPKLGDRQPRKSTRVSTMEVL